jgi:hypothetical protein
MRTDPAWTLDPPLLEEEEGSEGIGHFGICTPPHTRWVSYPFRKYINQHEYELEVTWCWF